MEINDDRVLCFIGDLREIKTILNTQMPQIQTQIESIKALVHKLENDIIEDKTNIDRMKTDIKDMHKQLDNLSLIEGTITIAKENISNLEILLEKHIKTTNTTIGNVNSDIADVNMILEKFPLQYQQKIQPKTWSEVLKEIISIAPGIIAIIGFVGSIIIMYIKNII